jgi:uncharacterized membrane protein YhhN
MHMLAFMQKKVLYLFWMVLLCHCLFQYLKLPYVAVTKPLLVPLLLAYLLSKDEDIGLVAGKFIFYVGMFLALFGDVLLISINDTFFMSGMIAFMLMNIAYSITFFLLEKPQFKRSLPVAVSAAVLIFIAYKFYHFLSGELARYRLTVLIYTCTVLLMSLAAITAATGKKHGRMALKYFVSGALVFLAENILVGLNRFHWDSNKDVYVLVMVTYGLAQYLFVKGIAKTYLSMPPKFPYDYQEKSMSYQ